MSHRYLNKILVKITVKMGGTDSQRLFVMNVERIEQSSESLLVVDHCGDVCFGSWDLAALLGWGDRGWKGEGRACAEEGLGGKLSGGGL